MTTDEIRTLIAQTIAGQGDQVDLGGSLGNILKGFADIIDALPQPTEYTAKQPLSIDEGEISLKVGEGLDTDTSHKLRIGDSIIGKYKRESITATEFAKLQTCVILDKEGKYYPDCTALLESRDSLAAAIVAQEHDTVFIYKLWGFPSFEPDGSYYSFQGYALISVPGGWQIVEAEDNI